jgi:hypothetical protein
MNHIFICFRVRGGVSQESWLGTKPGEVGINLSNCDGLLITLNPHIFEA